MRTLTSWECPGCPDLKLSNRPVRTRMPGGVAGVPPIMEAPYADPARGWRSHHSTYVSTLRENVRSALFCPVAVRG